jgi:hypothetical protein
MVPNIRISLLSCCAGVVVLSAFIGVNCTPSLDTTDIGVDVPTRRYGWPWLISVQYDYQKFGDLDKAEVFVHDAGMLPLKMFAREDHFDSVAVWFNVLVALTVTLLFMTVVEVFVRLHDAAPKPAEQG